MANHENMMDNRGEMESIANIVKSVEDTTRHESQPKPTVRDRIAKRFLAVGLAGGIALGTAGCADRSITTDTSGEITPTSTSENVTTNGTTSLSTSEVIVTPEDTSGTKVTANTEATDPKVTVKPATTVGTSAETQYITTTPTETTSPTATETTTSAEDLALLAEAGTLDGAETSIKVDSNGNRVAVYVAKEGNIYGVEAKTELGQYYANVEFEGKIIGARVLIPEVVKTLVETKLAETPEGEDAWVIFGAADLSSIKDKNTKVTMEVVSEFGFENSFLKTSFDGAEVIIANPIIESEIIGINNTGTIDTQKMTTAVQAETIGNDLKQSGLLVCGNIIFLKQIMGDKIPFGQEIGATTEDIYTFVQTMDAHLGVIDDSRILMNDGDAVFIEATETNN